MANDDVLIVLKEAVRTALYQAANEETKKLMEQFANELQKAKRETVGKIVEQIQIVAEQNPMSGDCVIQIRLSGGHNDGN